MSQIQGASFIYQYLFLLWLMISGGQAQAIDFETASTAYRSKDYPLAFEHFSELAAAGDAKAQTVIAIMHTYGEGIQVNPGRAFYWYQQAAEQGYPPAQFNVGIMLLDGSGAAEDRKQARYWLEQAASAGFKRASEVLAEMRINTQTFRDEQSITWSRQWNLRLPNEVREKSTQGLEHQYKVYRVQLGAMRTIEGAQRLWGQIFSKNQKFFGTQQPIFRKTLSSGRKFIRLQLGPFDSRESASQFCAQVLRQALSAGCLVLLSD